MSANPAAIPAATPSLFARLWYDKDNRSIAVQILAGIAILSFFGFMINNAVVNLNALGKGFSFNFLSQHDGGHH